MPNLYGVANPVIYPIVATLIGGADIVCPAGVETNILQWSNVAAISAGVYYPLVLTTQVYLCGATPPSGVNFNTRINNGADQGSYGVAQSLLVANANVAFSTPLIWAASSTLYAPPGVNVQVSVTPVGQSVTVHQPGSWAFLWLVRAPDA